MPAEPIPFVNALQSGDEELSGASPQALNVTVDGAGAVRRRPGIGTYFTEGGIGDGQVIGLHVTEGGDTYAAHVPDGDSLIQTYYRMAPGGAQLIGTYASDRRPVFAETEMLLTIAAGQTVAKIELASPLGVFALGGDPPQASHIIHNSLRLLGNDLTIDRTKIRYSDQAAGTTTYAGHEMWTVGVGTAGFFTAEAAPDPVVALGENTNEVWVFGSRTLQIFAPDPLLVFAPMTTMEVGCSAAYSVVKKEGSFYWLDHARRFVSSNGRGTELLSAGLHRIIQGFSRVDDCFGYRVLQGQVDGIVWTFPTEGRTFFVQEGAGWSEWTAWDSATNQFTPFPVTAHTYDRHTGRNIVGIPGHGMGVLVSGSATDSRVVSPFETEPIVASVTTGFINRGTDARKHCKRIRLTFRGGTGVAPVARGHISYRDSLGAWEPPIPIYVDGADPVCEITSLGTYRRRQWRYSFSDDVDELVLAGAEEVFEVTD